MTLSVIKLVPCFTEALILPLKLLPMCSLALVLIMGSVKTFANISLRRYITPDLICLDIEQQNPISQDIFAVWTDAIF